MRLFWGKMISWPRCLAAMENEIFRKITSYWPKFTPLTRKWFYTLIFTSNHFRVTQNTESERKNNTERERAKHTESKRKNESSDPATDTDLPHTGHAELSQTITVPNAADPRWVRAQTHTDPTQRTRSSSASRSRSSHSDHRAKHNLTVSFPEPVHRPHTHLTSDPHTSDPHTHLTSDPLTSPVQPILPIRSLHYIYIYLFIYIIIYFFYLLIFLIIHFLLNCVFMGYAYEILELFWLQVIQDWFLVRCLFRILELDWLCMIGFCCDFFRSQRFYH